MGPELAALYGVAGGSGPTLVTLPADQDRGGILGRAVVSTIHSHNTQTSPTHRGKFVRGRLLCQSIPPPPPGIVADLDAIEGEGTLRDRLSQHADDPACSGCHDAMDPLGYALEHFDPIGRRRELDNGYPIDATGELDGATFDGAAGLGAAVADHPELPGCVALQLYRHAGGQAERFEELIEVAAITDDFVAADQRFEALVLALIASDAFLYATAPLGEACDAEGDTRTCATACGEGQQSCIDGVWRGCDAPRPWARGVQRHRRRLRRHRRRRRRRPLRGRTICRGWRPAPRGPSASAPARCHPPRPIPSRCATASTTTETT